MAPTRHSPLEALAPVELPSAARLPRIIVQEGAHPPLSFERQRLAAWLSDRELRSWDSWQTGGRFVVELYTDHGTDSEDETTGRGPTLDAAIADALRIYGFASGEMP